MFNKISIKIMSSILKKLWTGIEKIISNFLLPNKKVRYAKLKDNNELKELKAGDIEIQPIQPNHSTQPEESPKTCIIHEDAEQHEETESNLEVQNNTEDYKSGREEVSIHDTDEESESESESESDVSVHYLDEKPVQTTEQKEEPVENKVSLLEEKFNKQITIIEKHIEIINALNTTPEIKNVLIKFEKNNHAKYQKYKDLVHNQQNADMLRNTLLNQYDRLDNETDGERYDENLRTGMKNIADLYKANGCDRAIVDLCNEMEDFIDAKRSPLMIEESPRFTGNKSSTYQITTYENQLGKFVQNLEVIQSEPKKFYHLYDVECDINNLELHHVPIPDQDYTIYRDAVNKLEYIMLYNGKWQVNTYDPRVD